MLFGFFMMYKSAYSFRFCAVFFLGRLYGLLRNLSSYQSNHTNETTLIEEKNKPLLIQTAQSYLNVVCVCF